MKYIFSTLMMTLLMQGLYAQQAIGSLSFQKNPIRDSLHTDTSLYNVYVVVELQDTVHFSTITCNFSTIDSTSQVYVSRRFDAASPGVFANGSSYTRDKQFIYLCLGPCSFSGPVVLEAILTDDSEHRVGYRSAIQ